MKSYFLIIIGCLIIASCKKEIPTPPINSVSPVFSLSGNLDGQNIVLKAGNGDTVMNSYQWKWNNVMVQTGMLGDANNYIKIELFSGDISSVTPNNQYNQLLQVTGAYIPAGNYSSLDFDVLQNNAALQSINWSLSGVNFLNDLSIAEPGLYNLDATVHFSNGLSESVSNDLYVGYNSNTLFQLESSVSEQIFNGAVNTTQPIDSVQWLIGNHTITTTSKQLQYTLIDTSHIIQATVFFQTGISRTRILAFDPLGTNYYLKDYVYIIENSLINKQLDYKARITITIKGITYESDLVENQLADMIKILKKEPYVDAITGKNAVKLTGTINTSLKNISTGQIVEGSFDVIMAFPYQ